MLRSCFYRSRHILSRRFLITASPVRCMATVRSSLAHEERTATEPRETGSESVVLTQIQHVNDSIRVLKLSAEDPNHSIKFLPGQWLDTFIPGMPKAGGFTITSTPAEAAPTQHSPPYLELAIQKSSNPPAQWLWQPEEKIIGSQLRVHVGGSFTWPQPSIDPSDIDRLVLIAGGVGINPLISIFTHLIRSVSRPSEIHFVYTTKAGANLDSNRILFLPRLMDLVTAAADTRVTLSLFLTGMEATDLKDEGFPSRTSFRRPSEGDLLSALDGHSQHTHNVESWRKKTLCYVCGPPAMTDDLVSFLSKQKGMAEERVLCEKWW